MLIAKYIFIFVTFNFKFKINFFLIFFIIFIFYNSITKKIQRGYEFRVKKDVG